MSAILTSRQRAFNPDNGKSFILTFTGDKADVDAVSEEYEGKGYKTIVAESGSDYTVTVTAPEYNSEGEEYTDRFNVSTDWLNIPIWNHQKVMSLLNGFGDIEAATIAVKAALADPQYHPTFGAPFRNYFYIGSYEYYLPAYLQKVWRLVQRDGDKVQIRRPVLKRNRSIPLTSASRMKVKPVEEIYKTPALIANFEIPSDIQAVLSLVESSVASLTIPADTAWAWKERQDDSQIKIGEGKATESKDFVYALWSTIAFDLISV